MEHLNLNLLRALAVLLQERHVTRSAEKLCLTQSAMSRQLSALREYFDDPLLVRQGSDYLLTARARQLRPQLEEILARIGQLQQLPAFDPAQCERRFCFACTDYVAQFIFPDILARLQRCAPGIDIEYRMWQPEWLKQLGTLPIDLAATMGSQQPDGLCSVPLGEDQPVCLMAQSHPLAAQSNLTLAQMVAFPFVQVSSGSDKDSFFDRALKVAGLQRRVLLSVPFFSAAFSALACSDSLLIVPEHIARNATQQFSLSWCPLPGELPVHRYQLTWHQIHQHDPAHRWLRQQFIEVIRQSIYSP